MELASKAYRAMAELITTAGHQCRQTRLRRAFCQRDGFLFEARAAIGIGEENSFLKSGHARASAPKLI